MCPCFLASAQCHIVSCLKSPWAKIDSQSTAVISAVFLEPIKPAFSKKKTFPQQKHCVGCLSCPLRLSWSSSWVDPALFIWHHHLLRQLSSHRTSPPAQPKEVDVCAVQLGGLRDTTGILSWTPAMVWHIVLICRGGSAAGVSQPHTPNGCYMSGKNCVHQHLPYYHPNQTQTCKHSI